MKHDKLFRPRTGFVVECAYCHKEVYVRPSKLRAKNYCSRECQALGQRKGESLICKVCGKPYYRPPSQIKWRGSNFCGNECKGRFYRTLKGERSKCWQGGKSSIYKRLRNGIEFAEWRKAVFERDNYTCQVCGARSVELHPHHKRSFTKYPKLRFEITNGITLCKNCHRRIHALKIRLNPLDKLFSKYMRLRADGVCEYCGKYVGYARLQTSHFHGRRKACVRYDETNCSCVCFTCHQYLGSNPYAHTEWFKKRLGWEKFEALNIRAEISAKLDKEAIKKDLEEKIEMLED